MQLYIVLVFSALSICAKCQSQPSAATGDDDVDLTTLMRMMERLDEKMQVLSEKIDRLEQQNEHVAEKILTESNVLMNQESFTKISNMTREKCEEIITEQQCLEKEDFHEVLSQLGEEIKQMTNITLNQVRDPQCHSRIDNDYAIEQLESFVGSMMELKSVLPPSDCAGYLARGANTSGVYDIVVNGQKIYVYCDMETAGGGWLVFQKRKNGVIDFDRTWEEYEDGFGYHQEEFWLGNKLLHNITSSGKYELRIDLKDKRGSTGYAQYDSFRIGSLEEKYMRYTLGSFSGDVGDCLRSPLSSAIPRGMKFSTKDSDNDMYGNDCATRMGAWWHYACARAYLNNNWGKLTWYCWKNQYNSIVFSEMKIRPVC